MLYMIDIILTYSDCVIKLYNADIIAIEDNKVYITTSVNVAFKNSITEEFKEYKLNELDQCKKIYEDEYLFNYPIRIQIL